MKTRADNGLSLIELVVAMALFALVAVMGVQLLHVSLTQRDRLLTHHETGLEVAQSLALLRQDLTALTPRLFFPPRNGGDIPPPMSALQQTPDGFAFSIDGYRPLAAPDQRIAARVIYAYDREKQTLSRQIWAGLTPVGSAQLSAPQPVMTGLSGLRLRSYWPNIGWVSGLRPPQAIQTQNPATSADGDGAAVVAETYSDLLPAAIEVVLDHHTGPLRMVESLR